MVVVGIVGWACLRCWVDSEVDTGVDTGVDVHSCT